MLLKISLLLILGGIAYLSLTPTETLVVGSDKLGHFIAYSALMANVGFLVLPNKDKLLQGMILCVLYGVIIEIIQYYIPGRVMSGWDVVANTIGVVTGALFTILVLKLSLFRKNE